ncbi:MAG: hypothetical protein HYX75_01025 [Acidobacteria bacterium]|nr:hypothetical protein [Acidobacteriota bacterium]
MTSTLLLIAVLLLAFSGVPELMRPSRSSQYVATVFSLAGSAVGLIGAVLRLLRPADEPFILIPWRATGESLQLGADPLSAFFLLPIFLISALGAIYGLGYWPAGRERKLRFFYGLLAASMALVVMSRDAISFLISWEVMALSPFFLVVADDTDRSTRRAGWLYLIATHTGTLCLFALFALLHATTGSYQLSMLPAGTAASKVGVLIFVLATIGFGLKAGIMPMHVWLPPAHASAPSHVSAIMSGVLIKMGIYGLIRALSLFPEIPAWWGGTILVLGVVSGVLGVAFALGQHDLKRLLAYHSVENIGIIMIGIGMATLGRSLDHPLWVALGLGGALFHVLNHSLFKSLLFYAAGSVIHATGTREMDHLGGLLKRMPRTGLAFLVGAVAISGLPPLNGFASEWLLYLGSFQTLQESGSSAWLAGGLAAPALALIGALACACFVKAFGSVFLGEPRAVRAAHSAGHEAPRSMIWPMMLIASLCAALGLVPAVLTRALDAAILVAAPAGRSPVPHLFEAAHYSSLSLAGLGLVGLIAVVALFARWRTRSRGIAVGPTWDCGYAAPSSTMQYTSSSFAQWLVGLFAWALRPRVRSRETREVFPGPVHFHSAVPDTVLDLALTPGFRAGAWLLTRARFLQQNRVQVYLLYFAVILIVLLSLV